MPVPLCIENAPEFVVQCLRERADRHRRPLEDEAIATLEAAVMESTSMTLADLAAEVRRLGVGTPSEAADIIRADRDGR